MLALLLAAAQLAQCLPPPTGFAPLTPVRTNLVRENSPVQAAHPAGYLVAATERIPVTTPQRPAGQPQPLSVDHQNNAGIGSSHLNNPTSRWALRRNGKLTPLGWGAVAGASALTSLTTFGVTKAIIDSKKKLGMSAEEQSAFDMQSAALESLESPEEEAQNERDKNAAMKAQGEFDAQRAAAKNSAPAQMNVMI